MVTSRYSVVVRMRALRFTPKVDSVYSPSPKLELKWTKKIDTAFSTTRTEAWHHRGLFCERPSPGYHLII